MPLPYEYRNELTDGLVGVWQPRWGRQLWSLGKVRKTRKCSVTGELIAKGSQAYRPVTNAGNRGDRISEAGMSELKNLRAAAKKKMDKRLNEV